MTVDTTAGIEAAAALRRLTHAVVGHDVSPTLLREVAAVASRLAVAAEAAAPRRRPASGMADDILAAAPDGGIRPHFAMCPIDGAANPLSTSVAVRAEEGDVVAVATLGPAHEGAPGRAHGGVVASLVDEVMGHLVGGLLGAPAFQGDLRIRYLAPVPLGEPLELRARLLARDERKLLVGLTITAGGDEVVAASGVHIQVALAQVGRPGESLTVDGRAARE